jgi:hypothetical protein
VLFAALRALVEAPALAALEDDGLDILLGD